MMRVFFLVFFATIQAKKSQLVCTSATDIKDCIFKNEDRIMELTKKNDLVWDKAVQIMLTVESLQKNVSTAEHVARSIEKATKNDRGQSELAEIKERMRGQEDLLLKMEKQVRETQAGLIHLASSNEAISSDLEAVQRKSEARRLTEEQILKKIKENEAQETTLKIENAVARINETETSIQKVNKQIAILEDEINKEKKRQKKELQNLQAALDENKKMENLQENINSIMMDLANLRRELDGNLDAESPPSLKKLEYRVATMTGQLNREKGEAQRKVKSLTSWIKKIFAGVKKDFEGHAAILKNITAQQEKLNEDVGSLKSAIEKTLDDSDKLRKKLVQNDQDRDLRLAKLELTVKNKDDIVDISERIFKMEMLTKKLSNHPEFKKFFED